MTASAPPNSAQASSSAASNRCSSPSAPNVPVTVTQFGELTAEDVEGYASLGVERVVLELPTEPRDETLRRLDDMAAEFAKLR